METLREIDITPLLETDLDLLEKFLDRQILTGETEARQWLSRQHVLVK